MTERQISLLREKEAMSRVYQFGAVTIFLFLVYKQTGGSEFMFGAMMTTLAASWGEFAVYLNARRITNKPPRSLP